MFKVFAVRISLVPETYEGVGMTQWVKCASKGTWLQSAATQKLGTAVCICPADDRDWQESLGFMDQVFMSSRLRKRACLERKRRREGRKRKKKESKVEK